MKTQIAVAGFGFVGVMSRYWIDTFASRSGFTFPIHTLAINALGSSIADFLLGVGTSRPGGVVPGGQIGPLIGFSGGFTTFSS